LDIGIFAHNEEQNIEKAIKSVQASKLDMAVIKQIIVVSSGSLDRTNHLVRQMMKKDNRIKLFEEAERRGKSAAINIFLEQTKSPIVITMSADLKVSKNAIEEIAKPFLNEEIGMVGAHPVPSFSRKGEIDAEIELLWELHHQVALISPKCGEMVAFRNIIRQIPHNSAVDEATIEVLLRMIGYSVSYAPLAIVHNRGPKTLNEFILQRRRVQAGHQWVFTTYNYKVSTMVMSNLLVVVLRMVVNKPTLLAPMIKLILMEALAQILGWVDFYILGRNPFTWKMISR